MGICVSVASSGLQEIRDDQQNAIYVQDNFGSNELQRIGSVYSKVGSKGVNQDAAIMFQGYGDEEVVFCGVFDGHGKNGHIVSKIVRNRLPPLLLTQKLGLTKNNGERDQSVHSNSFHEWRQAYINAFRVMDKEIKLLESLDCSCSGSTAVVAVKQGEDLVIANLGDSRALLGTITEEGLTAVQLTTDLKPSLLSEAERIRKCNGRLLALKEEPHVQRVWLPHEDAPGLAMSRAFGDYMLKNHGIISIPDISYRRLTPNDQFIVLATDGVWDVLSNKEVASIVCRSESEEAAAKTIVEVAVMQWKKKFISSKTDDCTAVCMFLQKR